MLLLQHHSTYIPLNLCVRQPHVAIHSKSAVRRPVVLPEVDSSGGACSGSVGWRLGRYRPTGRTTESRHSVHLLHHCTHPQFPRFPICSDDVWNTPFLGFQLLHQASENDGLLTSDSACMAPRHLLARNLDALFGIPSGLPYCDNLTASRCCAFATCPD